MWLEGKNSTSVKFEFLNYNILNQKFEVIIFNPLGPILVLFKSV